MTLPVICMLREPGFVLVRLKVPIEVDPVSVQVPGGNGFGLPGVLGMVALEQSSSPAVGMVDVPWNLPLEFSTEYVDPVKP